MAAERATPEAVAFMIRHTQRHHLRVDGGASGWRGWSCRRWCRSTANRSAPHLPCPWTWRAAPPPAFLGARSRRDHPRPGRHADAAPGDFAPARAHLPAARAPGGVLIRAGHTEAAVDLCRLAGFAPVGVLVRDHERRRHHGAPPAAAGVCPAARLKVGTIADLIRHRLHTERSVERIAEQSVQTELGEFRLYSTRITSRCDVHLALVHGRLDGRRGAAGARARHRHAARSARRAHCGAQPGRCARRWSASPRRRQRRGGDAAPDASPPRELAEARALASPLRGARARGAGRARCCAPSASARRSCKDLGVRRMRVLSAPQADARHLGVRPGDRGLRRGAAADRSRT